MLEIEAKIVDSNESADQKIYWARETNMGQEVEEQPLKPDASKGIKRQRLHFLILPWHPLPRFLIFPSTFYTLTVQSV